MRLAVIALLLVAARVGLCQDQAPAPAPIKNSTAPSPPVVSVPPAGVTAPEWVPLSDQEVVGTYFVGGFGKKYSLKLKEDGTFEQIEFPTFVAWPVQSRRGAAPTVLYGRYGVGPDTLWLTYQYKIKDSGPDEQKPDEHNQRESMYAGMGFVPVRWAGRLYLLTTRSPNILQTEVGFFYHKLYFGEIPLGPAPDEKRPPFYLREGDENKTVSGLPSFPKEWQGYMLDKPVTGKVLTFTNGGDIIPDFDNPAFSEISYARVTLNIGAADGVRWDMWFRDNKGNKFMPQRIEDHRTMLTNFDQRPIDDLTGMEISTHPNHQNKP